MVRSKFGKSMVIALGVAIILLISQLGGNAVKGAGTEFTLDPIPTVRNEVSYTAGSTATVGNANDLLSAYTNVAISRIVLTNDITVNNTVAAVMYTQVLSRSLQIDGQNHKLIFADFPDSIFGLSVSATNVTFHLKDLRLEKTAGNNAFKHLIRAGSANWDYIFDGVTNDEGVNFGGIALTNPNANIFFRGVNGPFKTYEEFWEGAGQVVFEPGSSFSYPYAPGNGSYSVFYETAGADGNVYFGNDSTVNIAGAATYPVFYLFRNFDIYPGANVNLHKATAVEGVLNSSGVTNQRIRVDSGAFFKLENAAGSAYYDAGLASNILSNPGANMQFVANSPYAAIYLTNATSKVIINEPTYYNIQNNNSATQAFYSLSTANPALQLKDTNLAAWEKGSNLAQKPTLPSPFETISLYTGNGATLIPSSAILNTMPGGWLTSKYSRLTYSVPPEVTASNQTIGITKTATINPTYRPANATLTYVSSNPSIAIVNASGVITGVSAGTTTIRVTATNPEMAFAFVDITVTVTNEAPVITAPTFTEIGVGGTFNPLTGVSASDLEDGDITSSIVVTNPVDVNTAGVYAVTYSVTDSDNNTATATQVVVVNDGTYGVGNTFILKATDFTKRIGQVDTGDAAIKTAAGITTYNKLTGAVVSEAVSIDSTGGYTATVGTYPMVFSITSDATASRSITATVTAGNPPVLTVPALTQINVGDPFDPLTGVTATDVEDGNLINSVAVTGAVNVNTAGVYTLSYLVTDSDNNTVTATQVVLVNDGTYGVGNNFILKADNFTKRIGQVDTSDAAIKTAAGIVTYNKLTGAVVSEPVTIDSTGGYTATVGTYPMTFSVTSDGLATKSITATVVAGDLPILTVPAFTQINVGDPFDPMTGVTATDTEDGVITSAIVQTGTVDNNTAGVYTLNYSVTDSDSNTVTATQVVLVNDGTYGVGNNFILKADNFTKRIGQVDISDAAVKTAAGVVTYNKVTGAVESEPVTINSLGGYGPTAGTYTIVFSITGDGLATRSITATVTAGDAPVLTVPAFTQINVGDSFDPMTGVTATDTEDGSLTGSIVQTGTVDNNTAGVYTLNYSVTDSDLNTATATQVVLVSDGSFAVGDDYILKASDFTKRVGQVDTSDAAIKLAAGIVTYDKLTGAVVSVPVSIDSNGGYTATVGTYPMVFSITSDSSVSRSITATVVAGDTPVLTVPAFTTINVGDAFDPMTGVSATDTEDGNLIGSVTYLGSVDVNTAAVYSLNYEVTDSDGNTATATQIVLVNDGSFAVGNDFILQANDFTKSVGQVDTSDGAIKLAAGVDVYNKLTGALVSEPVTIVSTGGYGPVVNTYPIELAVTSDGTATRTITATVIGGELPVLTVPAFTQINVGDSFNPMTGVSAIDPEDGDITTSVTHTGTVDVNTAGVYVLNYSVTDSDTNTVTATQVVLVNDGNYSVGDNFIVKASDFTIRTGQVNTNDIAVKAAAGITTYHKTTGVIANEPVVIDDNGGYTNVVADYTIVFSVASDGTATRTITASVIAGNPPVLTVPAFTQISVGDSFNPMTGVTATDVEDGNLTGAIVQTGSVDVNTAGVYTLNYSVTDSDGNNATGTQVVLVNDGTFVAGNTFIIKADDFTRRVGQVDTSEAAIKVAAGVETYDKLTGVLVNEPVTVNTGGYTNIVSDYTVIFTVTSDGAATKSITASVITGNLPVLTVPAFTEVNIGVAFNPMGGVSATDVEDGDLTASITHTGSVDVNTAGVYTLDYSVTDSDGNTVTKTRVVLVNDGNYTVGNDFILKADDFTKRVGQVDTSEAAIKVAAGVDVFNKLTGAQVSEPVTINSTGGYTSVVNDYTIVFSVTGDGTATRSITASVVAGNPPVLTVPAFTQINVGDSFDPMSGVTATDVEDGNLTGAIVQTGSVDNNTAGVYTLNYSVTDTDGNTVTATQVVLVNDGNYTVGNDFILKANDFTRRVGQVDTSIAAVKAAANVETYNKLTGAVVSEAVTIDSNGGYTNVVNDYTIVFSIASDPSALRSITASVVAGNLPVLTVPAFTEINLGDSFNPMTGVTATDVEDGNLTGSIVVTGTVDNNGAGVYTLHYSVTDSDNNTATATQVVLVTDGSFVVGDDFIINANDFTRRVGQVDTSDGAVKAAAGLITYDKVTGAVVTEPVSVNNGGYTNVVDNYMVVFTVTSDPTATKTITASVIAGDSPVLTAPAFTQINVGDFFDPTTGVTATDTEDGNLTSFITHTGTVDVNTPGVYALNYSVTDSDGNTTTATQVVLVNNGTYAVGDNYILKADNFTKRVGQVDTSDAAIKLAAGIEVYSKTTGAALAQPVSIDSTGGYGPVVNTYPITFSVVGDSTTTKTIVATVTSGAMPVLTVPAFTEINVGDAFNPMTGVSATDLEDGNLTSAIVQTGSVDANTAGVYTLNYSVTDSDSNTVTATQVVLVNDGNYGVGNAFILKADDFTRRISQVDTSDAAIKLAADVVVYDKLTGTVASEAVTIDSTGGYTNTVADYTITFSVTSDGAATRSITASVVTGNPPVLTVPAFTEIAVADPFNPMTGVSATDVEDGNLTGAIVQTGTVDVNTAGVYTLNYSVTDSDNNTVTATQVVLVTDGNFVVGNDFIIGASDFTKRIGQVDTSDAAIQLAAGVMVYDKATGAVASEAVTVNNGGYTNVVGSYTVNFTVTSDPAATRSITASVTAGNAPVLTVPAFTQISVGDPFDPMTGVSATDVEDGNLTGSVTHTGAVDINTAGVYALNYSVTDSDGNTATAIQVVLVNDGSFVPGTAFILEANDFTKRVGEVDTGDGAIKLAAGVKVYDKLTGDLTTEPVTIDSTGGYGPVVNTYPIVFTVTSDVTATKTITATVNAGGVPVLTVPAFTQINVGDSFNPMTGVSATDPEDGDLTGAITHTGFVNTGVAGIYTLNYSVTDSDGNTTTATQTVLVNNGQYVVGTNFILKASDFTKTVGQVDTAVAAIKAAAGVEVFDKLTGALTTEPVTINSTGGYGPVAGTYNIVFSVTSDMAATKTITATVSAGSSPTLTVPEFTQISVGGAFNPMTGVSAIDPEDGDITANIIVTGSVNTAVEGIYMLDYSITDSDSNTVTKRQVVLVNNGNFVAGDTYIIKASDFTKTVGQVDATNSGILTAAGVRVYDKFSGYLTGEPVTINSTGGYGPTVGTYTLSFSVTSDVGATIDVVGDVITGSFPTLIAPAFTEISLNGTFDIMAGVSASDPEDGDLTSAIIHIGGVDTDIPGVYEIVYSVIDSDNNEATATQVVLVNDGTFTAGTNYILGASDFLRYIGQVDTSDAAVKLAAGVSVFDKTTGQASSQPVSINSLGGYTAAVGDYTIDFSVSGDSSANRSIIASVIAGQAPVLTVPAFTQISVGSAFNPMTGVTAIDLEDGDITSSVIPVGTVDTSIAGVYTINYSVTDSDNNTVEATQVVLVDDGSFVVGNDFILRANDFTKRISQVNTTEIGILESAGVEVYHKATGAITVEPITIGDPDGYTDTVGNYSLTFTVDSDPSANKTIIGTVSAGNPPVLTVPAFTQINVGGLFNAMAGVTATDVEDGNLIDDVYLFGSVNRNVAGIYTIDYEVTDSDGNTATAHQTVLVNDGSYAVGTSFILFADDFVKAIGQVDTSDGAVIAAAGVQVYDKDTGALTSQPVTVVDKGGYTATVGTYDIEFNIASDPSAARTVVATVIAGNPPTISGAGFAQINVGDAFDPLAGVIANDPEDGDLTGSLVVTGSVDTNTVGIYTLTYSVTDSDSNTTTVTRVVLVNDGTYGVGSNFIIEASDFSKMVSEVNLSDGAILAAANVKVYDKSTGLMVSQPVTITNLGGYGSGAGTFTITFAVTGDSGAIISAEAVVTAGNVPVLTVPPFTTINVGGAFNPMTGVSAIDPEDGDITANVVVTGSVDTSKAGVYTLTYSITDADQNTVTKQQVVLVNDGTYVIENQYILHGQDFTIPVSQVVVTDAALIEKAQVRVYDIMTGLEIDNPIIAVDNGGYTNSVGVYDVSFTFNPTITVKATVIDDGSGGIIIPGLPTTGNMQITFIAILTLLLGGAGLVVGIKRKFKK